MEKEFKETWGWTDLAVNVAKETNTSFFHVMEKPVLAVITLAKYLADKIEILELKTRK